MQEKWNQFVYDLIESKAKNIEEEPYHVLIENQMQLLGWAKYRKEILHKLNVTTGRTFIQPDILIEKDAISVMKIPLELDNKRGARFVDLFSREKFNEKSIVDFCEECIEEKLRQENLNKIKESLISDAQSQIAEALRPYLAEKYNGTFKEDEIQEMLSTIHFTASSNEDEQISVSTPTISKPSSENPSQETPKRVYDYTEYSINGVDFYKKNSFVQILVKEYIRLHPEKTYAELVKVFPAELQGSFGVIQTLDYIHSKGYNGRRYFTEEDKILRSGDGILFAVSTEWSKNNLPHVIKVAQKLGFKVISSEEKPTLVAHQMDGKTGKMKKEAN